MRDSFQAWDGLFFIFKADLMVSRNGSEFDCRLALAGAVLLMAMEGRQGLGNGEQKQGNVDYRGYWERRGYSNEGELDEKFFDRRQPTKEKG